MTVGKQHEKPVYVRLPERIADAILAGRYADGDPLPSVRALAAEQQANPLTVAKAYQGFQDEGLIVVRRGVGMFVAPGARARLSDSERNRFLGEEWPEIRARMRRLGIDPDRKSTRLNSSHQIISYAVFCLKKKNRRGKSSLVAMYYLLLWKTRNWSRPASAPAASLRRALKPARSSAWRVLLKRGAVGSAMR